MSFVPPDQVVQSPAPIDKANDKRPPMLGAESTNSEVSPTLTDSPQVATFGHGDAGSDSTGPTSPGSAPSHRPGYPKRLSTADMPQIIPEEHEARTLILCFDGTGDQFDQDNSNIVQFFQLLKKDDRRKQMVYYQAGIGTSSKYFVTPVGVAISKMADMAVAHGLSDHVTDGYIFLMQNYIEGDKIAMFGFSRGAYTARALAGMLHKVGLLPPDNHQQVPFAYHMYQRDDKEGWEMSNGFKQAFSIDVGIHFMGLFDTVNSVGLIPKELPFAKSNFVVRNFRHAVALDERRAKFKANLWGRTTDEDAALAAPKREDYKSRKKRERLRRQAEEQKRTSLFGYGAGVVNSVSGAAGSMYNMVGSVGGYVSGAVGYGSGGTSTPRSAWVADGSGITPPPGPVRRPRFAHMTDEEKERWSSYMDEDNDEDEPEVAHALGGKHVDRAETNVEEVWFAGAHTDVGGGSVKNGERYSLARISLRWMVRQCFKCNTGIMFHTNMLEDIGLSPESLWPKVQPRPPPIRTFEELGRATEEPATPRVEINPPAYSALPSSTNDPKFNATHGYADVNDPRNPNAKKYDPYAPADLQHTQLAHGNNYNPYIPRPRFRHELSGYGRTWRVPREPFISEEVEDFKDALSPIYDQLTLNWWWWILEFLPAKQVWRKKERSLRKFFAINLGGPRVIKNQKRKQVKVHRTVQIRMGARTDLEGQAFSYSPRAWLKLAWLKWIGGAEEEEVEVEARK